ncbi:glycine cleavage system protein R [Biformimicrobium ophioploci]|uniref:Glycine cleavage system transcriptional repressor n=1 Tax=Biformimicrobium ophioploci TaxID=3036711 RepID=A0ABQ6LY18_9GAMM|nr:ACT domain-containing protein [Microbulbifer sp. NKW57]GMG86996.1 glycine cleavage system protein R [Microbulbifer sp. NKW57]
MQKHLIISLISDDRPGVLEEVASSVSTNGGNWEDSRMAHFAGKFAGIARVSVPEAQYDALVSSLEGLAEKGLKLQLEEAQAVHVEPQQSLKLHLVGNDRPGIVREVSRALAAHQINIEKLDTGYTSAPWSGEPLFTADCVVSISETIDTDGLKDELDEIADELGIDIDCEEIATSLQAS